MQEKPVTCRGINGSISLSKDMLTILGVGLENAESREIGFSDVSSIMVERKSVVPSATAAILAIIVVLIAQYNLLWFMIDLYAIANYITPIALGAAIVCGFLTVLRLVFVNVSVRSRGKLMTLRLASSRSAKRLAREFSKISARR